MTDADTTDRDAEPQQLEQDVADDAEVAPDADGLEERLVAEGEIAGDYLEELLDLLDFDGDIDLDVEGNRAVVSIDGGEDLNKLVGSKGEVLDALQELTRLAVHQKTGVRSRLMLDVASWRRRRREELAALGDKVARRVLATGERESFSHDSVRTQDRARRGGRGARCAQRERGCGAVAPGGRSRGLTRRVTSV